MANKGFWASLTSRMFIFIAILAIVAIGVGIVKSLVKRAEIEREIQSLRNEISEQKSNAEQLSRLIEYLNTEEFSEKEARLQLGLQKPGETVIVIPGSDLTAGNHVGDNTDSANVTNFQRWLRYLFNS